MDQPDHYRRHVFFCLHERSGGSEACLPNGARQGYEHCKLRIEAESLAGPGGVRVNSSGCLNRCAGGPVAVVYPEGVWYTFVDQADIDEIIDSHLKGGLSVARLRLPADTGR